MQFYSYRLMLRDYEPKRNEDEVLWDHTKPGLPHSGGLLFQQWLCDAYSRAEAQRLAWVLMRQNELRAETYHGLQDSVNDPRVCGRNLEGRQTNYSARYLSRLPQGDGA